MKRMASIALSLLMASAVVAEDTDSKKTESAKGRAILAKAAAALKQVKRVSYRADYTATGWVARFVATVQGTAVMGEQSKWEIDRFRCEVKLQKPDSSETLEFAAGSDGNVFFLVDSKTRTAHEDMDPAVLGSNGRDIQRVLMPVFSAPEPLSDELESDSIESTGTATVSGEECYKIHVKTDTPPELVWFLSKKDYLPRRVLRIYPNRRDPEGEEGTTQLTISDLVVNPKFAEDPFRLVLPEGFSKTDDFAP